MGTQASKHLFNWDLEDLPTNLSNPVKKANKWLSENPNKSRRDYFKWLGEQRIKGVLNSWRTASVSTTHPHTDLD